ncbi:MAG TPA: acyltransferase [Polyangiaceae bacterium]|nr:acyltransferase [Polyangiaceae bacterium]
MSVGDSPVEGSPVSGAAGATAHDRYLSQRTFGSLDGLRCLSILPVIWHHATPRPLPGIWGKGPAGVDLFFCISGFLITTLLLREKARTGSVALADFYVRRALRLLPLYYAALLAYAVFALCSSSTLPQRAHFFHTLPLYATFTANWFADFAVPHAILFSFAWSLCIEQQFYAFWPWLVRWLSARSAFLAMAALMLVDYCAERSALSGHAGRIVTSFSAAIGFGALLALTLAERRAFQLLYRVFASAWSAPLALASVVSLLLWQGAPLLVFQASLALLVGACVIVEDNGLAWLLRARAVSWVGGVSYGLYLLNSTAIGVVRRAFPEHARDAGFVFFASLPLALTLAALSHRYFETPFLRLRDRFRGPRKSALVSAE